MSDIREALMDDLSYDEQAVESVLGTVQAYAAKFDQAIELLRQVCMDWVPECGGDANCQCSAHRARRYLEAEGVGQ